MQLEQVRNVLLEAFGPEMRAGRRVDELRVDPHPVLIALHRAFEDVANAKFLADLLGVGGPALICARRGAGDHEAVTDVRQVRSQVVGDAVYEIVVARIAG